MVEPFSKPSLPLQSQQYTHTSMAQHPVHKALIETLKGVLYEPEGNMIGEEHSLAVLYNELINKDKRNDVLIIPSMAEKLFSGPIEVPKNVRYIISSMGSASHHTGFLIDREKREWYNFDSLAGLPGGLSDESVFQTLESFRNKGLLNGIVEGHAQCRHQKDDWSCGYHVINNILGYIREGPEPKTVTEIVSGHIKEIPPSIAKTGEYLKKKYEPLLQDAIRAL